MDLRTWVHKQPDPVEDVIKRLASEVGVRPPSIRHWVYDVRDVPLTRCKAVARATAGEVSEHDLRPDFFDPPADQAA